MNYLHLQEAAKHYARLAEEAQKNLEQEQELNEDLLTIIDALCEELGIDTQKLLGEMAMTTAAYTAELDKMAEMGPYTKGRQKAEDKLDAKLRSDKVYGEGGKVVHPGARGLGWSMSLRNPSDKDVEDVKGIVGKVGHIVSAPDDPDYATDGDYDTTDPKGIHHDATYISARPHPVHSRTATPPATLPASAPAKKTAKKVR